MRWFRAALTSAILMTCVLPASASASVVGKKGVEIEGARDRRGLYFGAGVQGGVYMTGGNGVYGAPRLEAAIGAGARKNLTFGLNAHLAKYFGPNMGGGDGWSGGGDLEMKAFLKSGFVVGGGLGFVGAPEGGNSSTMIGAIGGFAGAGYEFFLNQSTAMSIGLDYDLRLTTDTFFRHGPWVNLRFRFY